MNKTVKWTNLTGTALFLLFAYGMLVLLKQDLLYRCEELSLFIPDMYFFKEFIIQPGGLIPYLGTFLTQFCYLPWLGALLITLTLWMLQTIVFSVLVNDRRFYLLSFFPSFLILLYILRINYNLYEMIGKGYLFSIILGLISTLALVKVYNSLQQQTWKRVWVVLIAVVGYPLLGFYALLTLMIIAIFSLNKFRKDIGIMIPALCLIAIVPFAFQTFFYSRISPPFAYFSGLPVEDLMGMKSVRLIYAATFITVILLKFIPQGLAWLEKRIRVTMYFSMLTFIILIGLVFKYRNHNESFHAQLKMERLIDEQKWEEALKVANQVKSPTRVIHLYRVIALLNLNRLPNDLFTIPMPSAIIDPKQDEFNSKMCGTLVYYYFGQLNFSQRWAMERTVTRGYTLNDLKYQAKTAILNREKELAKRYLDLIGKNLFHKKWAKHYNEYLTDTSKIETDSEFKNLRILQLYDERYWVDSNSLENTILRHFSAIKEGPAIMLELSICSLLMVKMVAPFWERFFTYSEQNRTGSMPNCFIEAALMFSALKDQKTYDTIVKAVGENSSINKRFREFVSLYQQYVKNNQSNDLQTLEFFKKKFGNTYWYYYIYTPLVIDTK